MKQLFLIIFICLSYLSFSQNSLNTENVVKQINNSKSSASITYGAISTFNAAAIEDVSAVALSADKFVVAYCDWSNSLKGTAIIGTVTGSTIAWGSEYVFNTGQTQSICVEAIDENTFVVAYRDISNSAYGTARIGSVTGSTISYNGSETIFNNAETAACSIKMVNSNYFVIAYTDGGNSSFGTSVIGYFSGSTISFGAGSVYSSTITNYNSIIALSSYKVVVSYRAPNGYSRVGTISGTTITWGSQVEFNNANTWDISAAPLSDSRFVLAYSDAGNGEKGTAVLGTVSGTVVSFSAENLFNPYQTRNFSIIKLDESHVAIAFYYYNSDTGTPSGSVIIGSVSGSIFSWGDIYSYLPNSINQCYYNSIMKLSTNKIAIAYKEASPYHGKAIIGNISGGDAVTWHGTVDNDWNTAANWSGGEVPSIFDDVIITDDGIMPRIKATKNASCKDLTVNPNAILTIESTASGTGSLITDGTIYNNGAIHVDRYISDDDWHLFSSPITTLTAANFLGNNLQYYSEPSNLWIDIVDPETTMLPLKGYGLWSSSKASTFTFIGTPNNGDQNIAVTNTDNGTVYKGFNLIGNPYPSYLDWNDLDDEWGAIYYWDGVADIYVQWNNGIGSGSKYIPPMQAFFILTSSNKTFSVNNVNRAHSGGDNYYKNDKNQPDNIVLYTINGAYKDELYIQFNEQANNAFDFRYDAYKLLSNTNGISQLYSIYDETALSIDVRPSTDLIQLGFQNNEAGLYNIGFQSSQKSSLILEDIKNQIFHDFLNGEYEFQWELTDDEKRFKLHFNPTGLDILSMNQISIYSFGNQIRIQPNEMIYDAQVQVFDIMGREVYRNYYQNLSSETITIDRLGSIFIIVIKTPNQAITRKVLINKNRL